MFRSALLVVVLVLAAAIAFPADRQADLIISAMEANANETDNQIADFEIISPKLQLWDKAEFTQGKFSSGSHVVRTGDASMSLATGKLILTTPFRLDSVAVSFDVTIIAYFVKWFQYTQTVTANHIGSGTLQIQLTTVGDQCQGDFYSVDIKFDNQTMTEAGTPVPDDVTFISEINDFVTSELSKRYQSNVTEWAKSYVEAVTRKALVGLNFC